MCLSACHYDHATDVHKKLAVMAKCESSELSRCCYSSLPCVPAHARCSSLSARSFCWLAQSDLKRTLVCVRARDSRHYISYKNGCTANPHDCNVDSMGCGGEYRADHLAR
jgi:hypothetical protein